MYAFTIGQSALAAGQRALDVIGQNIANANTPGYHQQDVALVAQVTGNVGSGVGVAQVTRSLNTAVQNSVIQSNGDSALLASRVATQQQAESYLNPGTNGLNTQLSSLFNNITQLSSTPDDPTQRSVVVASASALAQQFNSISTSLGQQRADLGRQVQQTVAQINQISPQIASLNVQIAKITAQGGQPNDLQDQRGTLINQLSGLTDVRVTNQPDGTVNVQAGNVPLVVGQLSGTLVATSGAGGNIGITETSTGLTANPTGGTLGGLLQDNNVSLPGYLSQLNTLAQSLISQVDTVQATGLNSSGPYTTLTGTRGVSNPTATLASLNLPIAPQAGTLNISVTNTATGQRTLDTVAINPATQSLQDVANAISTATGNQVQGSVNATTGTLQLQAQSGYSFDFAGQLPSTPTNQNLNGTTVPQVTGTYTGSTNDTYNFQIQGNGTIGTTAGLQLQVTNSSGAVISTVNVGSGYTPGTAIDVGNGVQVALSAGTSNNGTFSDPVVANPDTSGILASLGVNSFFSGTDANSIAVNPTIAANPSLINASRSGQPGDGSNLQRFAAVQDAKSLSGNTQTLGGYFSQLVGSVGTSVSSLNDQQTAQTTLAQNLTTQEQSVEGVDVNQQMLQMLNYQNMVSSASKYLSVVNSTLDSILNIIK